jgi:hypothetical protein
MVTAPADPRAMPIVTTALLALTIGGFPPDDASRVARTGLGDMALTRQEAPRVVRMGRGDMTLTAAVTVDRSGSARRRRSTVRQHLEDLNRSRARSMTQGASGPPSSRQSP